MSPVTSRLVLGRASELAAVDDLLDRAGRGRAGICLVVGEAGVGKTALCREAMQRAAGRDPAPATVLAARGVEDEARFAYNVLADLLGPLSDGVLPRLPEPLRLILDGVVGRSVARSIEVPGVGVAVAAALAAAAEVQPVLVVVDDAHWSDLLSLEALAFSLRRLDRDRVATLLATRPPVPRPLSAFAPLLELHDLEVADAADLVRSVVREIDPRVALRLATEAGGNPLVLTELSTLLAPEQLRGLVPLPDPLPVGPQVALSFARPIQALPPPDSPSTCHAGPRGECRRSPVGPGAREPRSRDR